MATDDTVTDNAATSETPADDTLTSFAWHWAGQTLEIGMTRRGQGPRVLLLPALSSISTRREMRALQEAFSDRFEAIACDMPGFGAVDKPSIAWSPAAYRDFLARLLAALKPFATIAAGHMASYALEQAAEVPGSTGRLVMISPTWRGPLPTVMGRRAPFLAKLARFADTPVLGQMLYRLNVNRPMVKKMARGHVYADADWLVGDRLAEKMAVANARGARHGSVRFVCGELDPFLSREDFLAAARRLEQDVLLVYGSDMPSRSRGEVEALIGLPHFEAKTIPGGKLALPDEFGAETAAAIAPFLDAPEPDAGSAPVRMSA